MSDQIIIGLCGYAKVGKDTIAARLPGFHRAAFADELKNDVEPLAKKLGLDLHYAEDKELFRPVLVEYGRAARKKDPDIWINRLARYEQGNVVITDVRYSNEVEFITDNGGIVFRIERAGRGPANGEELSSFMRIEQVHPLMPRINNNPDDLGESAAKQILEFIRKDRNG